MGTLKLQVSAPGSYELGRSRDVELRVENATVSRRHARLTLTPERDRVLVRHTQGSNPTTVNGMPLTGDTERVLAAGDVVEVGEVKLTVSLAWE
jgi:pSer/pThr/pTyr-binding forkhead associated (FHA) protein